MITSLRFLCRSALLCGLVAVNYATSLGADPTVPAQAAETKIKAAMAKLSDADRAAALEQRWCAVQEGNRLGSMGTPIKVLLDDKPVFLCCAGCKKKAMADAKATVKTAEALKKTTAALAKLSADDRGLAEAQRFCAVMDDSRLGSMGTPVKVTVEGKPVFLCCKDCEDDAKANPKDTLAKVEKLKKANSSN